MKLKSAAFLMISSLACAMAANANEVLLTSNQPMKIEYRIAHKNLNSQPVFGEIHAVNLDKSMHVPISLDDFDRAGIVILSANGHQLPPEVSEFDKQKSCSMITDKTRATGSLELSLSAHSISCRTEGGVFG